MNVFRLRRKPSVEMTDTASTSTLREDAARCLCQRTGTDRAWFLDSESGAWAAAMTLARKWGELNRRGQCGVVAAGVERFKPLIETAASGLCCVPLNDLAATHAAVDSNTVAILIDPAHKEVTASYLQGVEKLCRELRILLVLNESRSSVVRCEETYGVRADILILGEKAFAANPSAALVARGHACVDELTGVHGLHARDLMPARPTLAYSREAATQASQLRAQTA